MVKVGYPMRLFWPLTLFFLLAVALTLGPALGSDSVSIEVTGASAHLRDVLGAAGTVPPDKLGASLVDGLRPGEERVLTPAELSALLVELRLNPKLAPKQAIAIRRRSRVLPAADLVAAGEKAIRERLTLAPGTEASVSPALAPQSLLAPVTPVTLDAAVRPPSLPGGLWSVEVTARADDWDARTTIRFRVRTTANVLVTRRAVRRGELLTEANVTSESRDLGALRGEPLRSAAELQSRRAARPALAGTVLTSDWVEPVPVVRRGETVTATARAGGVTASTRVTALRDGGVGEVISVRPQGRTAAEQAHASEFAARVAGPGQVEVVSP